MGVSVGRTVVVVVEKGDVGCVVGVVVVDVDEVSMVPNEDVMRVEEEVDVEEEESVVVAIVVDPADVLSDEEVATGRAILSAK